MMLKNRQFVLMPVAIAILLATHDSAAAASAGAAIALEDNCQDCSAAVTDGSRPKMAPLSPDPLGMLGGSRAQMYRQRRRARGGGSDSSTSPTATGAENSQEDRQDAGEVLVDGAREIEATVVADLPLPESVAIAPSDRSNLTRTGTTAVGASLAGDTDAVDTVAPASPEGNIEDNATTVVAVVNNVMNDNRSTAPEMMTVLKSADDTPNSPSAAARSESKSLVIIDATKSAGASSTGNMINDEDKGGVASSSALVGMNTSDSSHPAGMGHIEACATSDINSTEGVYSKDSDGVQSSIALSHTVEDTRNGTRSEPSPAPTRQRRRDSRTGGASRPSPSDSKGNSGGVESSIARTPTVDNTNTGSEPSPTPTRQRQRGSRTSKPPLSESKGNGGVKSSIARTPTVDNTKTRSEPSPAPTTRQRQRGSSKPPRSDSKNSGRTRSSVSRSTPAANPKTMSEPSPAQTKQGGRIGSKSAKESGNLSPSRDESVTNNYPRERLSRAARSSSATKPRRGGSTERRGGQRGKQGGDGIALLAILSAASLFGMFVRKELGRLGTGLPTTHDFDKMD